mgnify:CR=1 FL=1
MLFRSDYPYFTAQFHPEAMGGPIDTEFLFDVFIDAIKTKARSVRDVPKLSTKRVNHRVDVKKVLLLGSGVVGLVMLGRSRQKK